MIKIELTKFQNIDLSGSDIIDGVTYGYRIYDDYGEGYNNTLTEEESKSFTNVKEVLALVAVNHEIMYEQMLIDGRVMIGDGEVSVELDEEEPLDGSN